MSQVVRCSTPLCGAVAVWGGENPHIWSGYERKCDTCYYRNGYQFKTHMKRLPNPWWVKVPWQNYDEMGECPKCVRCGVSTKLNSPECDWGEGEDEIFNVCNGCAAELLREMWSRRNETSVGTASVQKYMNQNQTPHPDQTLVETVVECIRQMTDRKLVTGLIQIANASQQSLRSLRQDARTACLEEWRAQNPDRVVAIPVWSEGLSRKPEDDQDLDSETLGPACDLKDGPCESCQ